MERFGFRYELRFDLCISNPSLLLILSAGALALPSNHTKCHGDSWPNIAAYSDSACMNEVSPSQDFKGCVSIGFTSKYVGVNWVNWPVSMDAFDAFKDVSTYTLSHDPLSGY